MWMGVLAVPVAAAGYLIYQKAQSFAGQPEPTVAAPAETPQVVAVAPSYADPKQLRRKQDLDSLRQQEALARQKQQEEQAATGPRVYQSEEDYDELEAREEARLRQKGVKPYKPYSRRSR